ncbi:MBL fold metallo-hydrolase [Treponema sp.]|uniref:MBL fold metallo-hydrolase n=1 Tax=Treponema sp. TaxID=166 RepID=UPI0025DE9659|nr:MBL fold metallo-hydrolase [Treponema sp.]MCR5218825.1 MBL fold metallo-hydrolase [Treponema sp.]
MAITKSCYVKLSQNCGYFNTSDACGIVTTASSVYIIDTGVSSQDGEDLVKAIGEIFPQKKIAAIINTHSHSDHSGGNAAIVRLTGAQVWCSEKADCILRMPEITGYLYSGGTPVNEIAGHNRVKSEYSRADRFIKEETIEIEGVKLSFIPSEGHFFGHYGILADDGDKKVYFLGDGFFGKDMLKKAWLPFIYDGDAFRKSIEKIEKTECDYYVAAHGGVYTKDTVHAAAELNIMVTLEAELKILKLLKKKAMSHEEILKEILDFAGIKPKLIQYLLIGTTIQSYLSCLCNRGLIKYRLEDNRMLWYNDSDSDSDYL